MREDDDRGVGLPRPDLVGDPPHEVELPLEEVRSAVLAVAGRVVGRLDQQPDPAGEHVLDVQCALVGDRVRDLGPQVGMPVKQRLGKRLLGADQLEHLAGE